MEAQLQEVSRKVGHPELTHRGHSSSEVVGMGRVWPPCLPFTPQAGMDTVAPDPGTELGECYLPVLPVIACGSQAQGRHHGPTGQQVS